MCKFLNHGNELLTRDCIFQNAIMPIWSVTVQLVICKVQNIQIECNIAPQMSSSTPLNALLCHNMARN